MRRALSFSVVFCVLSVAGDCGDVPTPSRFESLNPHKSAPVWISAAEAFSDEGHLRPNAISATDERILELAFQRYDRREPKPDDDAPCQITLTPPIDDAPGLDEIQSWKEMRERAATGIVVAGVVEETVIGLYAGRPYTLLRIDPKRSNRGLPYSSYVIYPRGTLKIRGKRICTHDPAFADAPRVGDRIVFIATQPIDTSGTLYRPPATLILYERSGNLIASPAAVRAKLPFHTLDEYEGALIEQRGRTRTR